MGAKYHTYPEYKDSGVEWLERVPMDWNLVPLKYLSRFSGGGTPSKDNPEYWSGDIPWVSPKDMKAPNVKTTIDNITESAIRNSSTGLLREGALLIVVRSGILQHSIPVAINDVPVALNQDMKALRFNERINVRFALNVVIGNQKLLLLEWSKQGATVESIEQEYLANTLFPVPPIEHQVGIANFLDHETAKIDTLIEKQQQLIKLLKEKRQAVISHAVTKGLNPNAPMRVSGVEWLGEVPAHWELPKLIQRTTNIGDGLHSTPRYQVGTGYYFVNGNNLDEKILIGATAKEVPLSEFIKHHVFLDQRSVLLSINGTIGNVARYNGENIILGKSAAYMNCGNGLLSEYLLFYLQSSQLQHYYSLEVTGTTIFNLSLNSIRQMRVCIPPENEQKDIASYCATQKEKYATLICRTISAVMLMNERRTALISAAVTGKIDVRNWQNPNETSTAKEDAA